MLMVDRLLPHLQVPILLTLIHIAVIVRLLVPNLGAPCEEVRIYVAKFKRFFMQLSKTCCPWRVTIPLTELESQCCLITL